MDNNVDIKTLSTHDLQLAFDENKGQLFKFLKTILETHFNIYAKAVVHDRRVHVGPVEGAKTKITPEAKRLLVDAKQLDTKANISSYNDLIKAVFSMQSELVCRGELEHPQKPANVEEEFDLFETRMWDAAADKALQELGISSSKNAIMRLTW